MTVADQKPVDKRPHVVVPRAVNYARLYANLGKVIPDTTLRQQVLQVIKETLEGK